MEKILDWIPNYIIYSNGTIKNKKTNNFLKGQSNYKNKYCSVNIPTIYGKKRLYIHRLVAEAFLPNPSNKIEVNHKDGNVFNNNLDNLEWVSPKENMKHAQTMLGFTPPSFSEESRQKAIKKTSKPVIKLDASGRVVNIYNSISEAALENNVSRGTIRNWINDTSKTNEYHWKYR